MYSPPVTTGVSSRRWRSARLVGGHESELVGEDHRLDPVAQMQLDETGRGRQEDRSAQIDIEVEPAILTDIYR
jgi:hypothetical protein